LRKDPRDRFASCVELARSLGPFGPPGSLEKAERIAVAVQGVPNDLRAPTVEIAPEPVLAPEPDPRRAAPTALVRPQTTVSRAVFAGAAAAIALASLAFIIARVGRTHAAPALTPEPVASAPESPPPESVAIPTSTVPVIATQAPQDDDPPNRPSATPVRRARPRAAPSNTDSRAGFGERK
jgi:hypothetical protein